MPCSLQLIRPEDLNEYWPVASVMLIPALEIADDGTSLEEVHEQITTQKSMLWIARVDRRWVMSFVLSIENGALYAWLIGGELMDEWLDDVIVAMKRYAKESGLTHLKSVVRPGLGKKLRAKGWKTTAEIIRTEL